LDGRKTRRISSNEKEENKLIMDASYLLSQ
jgi:hypothetical protein